MKIIIRYQTVYGTGVSELYTKALALRHCNYA